MRFGREPHETIAEEVRIHIEMEAEALERAGMSPADARREARRKFGGVDRYTEELRDVRGGQLADAMLQDAKHALRLARRFPSFTIIVLVTLGIAIGATTAIFSVVDTVLLRPLPFPQDDRLVLLYGQNPDKSLPRFSVSYADFMDWQRQTKSFTAMAAYAQTSMTFAGAGDPERLPALAVTGAFFDVLGTRPRYGRLFHANDPEGETSNEIVVTYGFWQRHFAGDSSVVGRGLRLGGGSRIVIGILPPDFDFLGSPVDAITVIERASIPNAESHANHTLAGVARLAPGVSLAAAQQDLSIVADRLAHENPQIAGWSANVFLLRDEMVRGLQSPLLVLLAAAGLVLLIGCINVANLLLTRSAVRERELALRQAIGASHGRLVRQLLIESAELAIGGSLLGLAVAKVTLFELLRVAPAGLLPARVPLDARALGFAALLAIVTTLIAGLWPAIAATRGRLAGALNEGGRSGAGGLRALRSRRSLVIAETALALVLLICAGLVAQSLRRLLSVNPGFRAERVVTMRVSLPGPRYSDTTQIQFFRDLQSRLSGREGIEAVAAANTPPISAGGVVTNIRIIGRIETPGEKLMAAVTAVTPGYFQTMGMPMLRGHDVEWTQPKATLVVSQSFANLYWPEGLAIGKRVGFGFRDTLGLEIVGVVGDTHARGLAADALPMIYLSYDGATQLARTMTIVVRGRGDPATAIATTRQVVHEIDGTLPLYSAQSMRDIIDQSVGQPRLNSTLLGFFAFIALALAVIGIYGVVQYSVAQRTHEIGIRMALGARQSDVSRLVLLEGGTLATIGVAIGVAGALAATPLIRSWLFGIEATDPVTIVGTSLGLIAVAVAASYLPARRAAKVDPVIAMRGE